MLYIVFSLLTLFGWLYSADDVVTITIGKSSNNIARMPLFWGILDHQNLKNIIPIIKSDIQRSGQFSVTVESQECPTTKKDINAFFNKGFALALFISYNSEENAIELRLYDTVNAQLIKGKKIKKGELDDRAWAHYIAQEIWQELMPDYGSFRSYIGYIKRVPHPRFKSISKLCICDFEGKNEQVLHSSNKILLAPCWARDEQHPYMLCSEFTNSNVRLISVDLKKRYKVALDLDGTTAGISFSKTGDEILYGRSGGLWLYRYDKNQKKGHHRLIIKEKHACASPNLKANGDIIYCSQGKIKEYNAQSGKKTAIVEDGYCVGPAYHEKDDTLAFSKRVNGSMQLFVKIGKHSEQLTFGKGDKTDACWAPCGMWLAYTLEKGGKRTIMVIHIKTKVYYTITSDKDDCLSPCWSSLSA